MPIPKAELHVHIEGTLEPELAFRLAERNDVSLPFRSIIELRKAYSFDSLQSFLDLYYQMMQVLRTEQDFEDLAAAYLARAARQGVRHAEIFFDPQAHSERGIPIDRVINGLSRALQAAAERHGMTTQLILCFLRHLPQHAAVATLREAEPHLDRISGVGLDSSELGHPPEKFRDAFAMARDLGLRCVAHAGEEGPADYIRAALDELNVERIDHGVRCLDDGALVARLRREQIPLTVCPLSNVRLRVVDDLAQHPLRTMLAEGLLVTINSDDPAYFGGYVEDNFTAVRDALGLGEEDIRTLARNSFHASFLTAEQRSRYLAEVDAYRFS
ncbi:adenosine deaminase [Saccharopolyspora sp. K220]|uniref:adenosine deaminase n=1 Tax=Saccharopolyspora soli TaxID=2926618 RepID=UPI001F584A02|nr:adenosine deaminase [Saccharopolyspora soli]MCI2415894.1 adenosine deaminase [Saccharopolyspora soli]